MAALYIIFAVFIIGIIYFSFKNNTNRNNKSKSTNTQKAKQSNVPQRDNNTFAYEFPDVHYVVRFTKFVNGRNELARDVNGKIYNIRLSTLDGAKREAEKLSNESSVTSALIYPDIDFIDNSDTNDNLLLFIYREGKVYADYCSYVSSSLKSIDQLKETEKVSDVYTTKQKTTKTPSSIKNSNQEKLIAKETKTNGDPKEQFLHDVVCIYVTKIIKEKTIKYKKLIEKHEYFRDKGLLTKQEFEIKKSSYLKAIDDCNFFSTTNK